MPLGTGQIRLLVFSFSRLASFDKIGALFPQITCPAHSA